MIKVNRGSMSTMGVSLLLHLVILTALSFVVFQGPLANLQMVLDTVFDHEEREYEEIVHEVEESTVASEAVNFVTGPTAMGATVSSGTGTGVGSGTGTGLGISQQKIDQAVSLKAPDIKVNMGAMSVPGMNVISKDLGTGGGGGQVVGEGGRVVEGYGAALGQMTQELVRLMRESKVHIVWLFDESESMTDDQKEIRERFYKVYEELGLVQRTDAKFKAADEILLTTVMSFGERLSEHTQKPTANPDDIKAAIDRIKVDASGLENTCAAITSAVGKFGASANRQKRKLVVIVVSDESGDDGEHVEDAIQRCKSADASVYVLGRYSVFGYPYARLKWIDPKYGLPHWLDINRGPETAFPECLQFDGLHGRWDVFSSGVGPYEQVRIAKQTGGIFFLLPGKEDNLAGTGSLEQRKFEMLDMKEYLPEMNSRMEYLKERDTSKFRDAQWQVIATLNPHKDKQLDMKEHHYSLDPNEFSKQGKDTFDKAVRAMGMLNQAVNTLDSVKKLRDKESSERWRANYDLMHAQCLAYRVRLFQLLLSLDAHQKNKPVPKDPKNNFWNIHRVKEMLEPDKEQVRQTKVDMAELKKQNETAKTEFKDVIERHPGTPWARRAKWELDQGFGMKFVEAYWDPRYFQMTGVKVPKQ